MLYMKKWIFDNLFILIVNVQWICSVLFFTLHIAYINNDLQSVISIGDVSERFFENSDVKSASFHFPI